MKILTKDNKLKDVVSCCNSQSFISDIDIGYCESCGRNFTVHNGTFLHECNPIALDCLEQRERKCGA